MSHAPAHPCRQPGCPAIIPAGQGSYCPVHAPTSAPRQARRRFDAARGHAAARGYDHRWQRERLAFLAKYPICHGVLRPTPDWTPESAQAYHARREQQRAQGNVLWVHVDDPATPYTHEPWDAGRLATIVDHIIPHKGDPELMWSEWNWQPLTKRAHDKKTATEKGGGENNPGQPHGK